MMTTQTDNMFRTITLDEGAATVSVAFKRYEFLLNDLIRDRNSGGRYNYYSNTDSTSYDVAIARGRIAVAEVTQALKTGEQLIEKFSKEIANSRLEPNDLNYKKLNQAAIVSRQSAIAAAMDENFTNERDLATLQKCLDDNIWSQYVEQTYNRTMRAIRNRFYINGDVDWARRAITWIVHYTNRLRGDEPEMDWPEDYCDNTAW